MLKAFLSYAHEDILQARRLYKTLDSIPTVSVWFDKESLLPGQKWEIEIRRAIKDSRLFLLLLSNNSTSKKGFYQREIRLALQILEEYPDSEIFLIPIRLDDCKSHFEQLTALQYVDLFPDWDAGITRILRVIQTHRRPPLVAANPAQVRFTSHQARFVASKEFYYFLNITNLGERPLEITHLWYEDATQHIPIRSDSRPLPKRLDVSEAWSSWIPLNHLPEHSRHNAYELFKLRLSSGEIFASIKENSVPPYGSVPGGRIRMTDIESFVSTDELSGNEPSGSVDHGTFISSIKNGIDEEEPE